MIWAEPDFDWCGTCKAYTDELCDVCNQCIDCCDENGDLEHAVEELLHA